jgi:excisionase family DNA binding protein
MGAWEFLVPSGDGAPFYLGPWSLPLKLADGEVDRIVAGVARLLQRGPQDRRRVRPGYVTLKEVAELTRAPLSSVRGWVYSGKLLARKVGKRVLVAEGDLAKFMGAKEDDDAR